MKQEESPGQVFDSAFRLPQVILDVGVELDGFGPAVAEDGLTDVLFI